MNNLSQGSTAGNAPDSEIGCAVGMRDLGRGHAVSQVVGLSAIHLARVYGERKRKFVGQHFWARGYFVSTVGRDEKLIREYIRKQEADDTRLDQ